ncbi:MAG: flagellar hook-basal body complex protein [Vampirovibrionales bacterium]|jgi:flagellar hook protein FlgE
MTQGLYIAASGIRANQTAIDVISNNISNVNTTAFKSSKANFETTFLRTITAGGRPTLTQGGYNPMQTGSGTTLSEINTNYGQGGSQFTGRSSDMLISGEGYFVSQDLSGLSPAGTPSVYTRAGNFSLDADNYLVTSSGDRLVGTSQISGDSPVDTNNIQIPKKMKVAKFLDVNNKVIATALGQYNALDTTFAAYATANGIPAVTTVYENADMTTFNVSAMGAITANYSNGDRLSVRANPNGATNKMELVHLTNQGGTFSAINPAQASGRTGQLSGADQLIPNNTTGGNPMEGMTLQMQTVAFTNKNGLIAKEGNQYIPGPNVGEFFYGTPGSGSRGRIQTGSLESSNVDMALEFSNLVVAQRGLEANSKIIRTQSEVMQSIINAVG